MQLRARLQSCPFPVRLIVWAVLLIVSSLLSFGLCMCIAQMTGADMPAYNRWLLLGQNLGLFILPPLALAFLSDAQPGLRLRYSVRPSGRVLLLSFLLMVSAIPAINLLADLNSRLTLPSSLAGLEARLQAMEQSGAEMTKLLLSSPSVVALVANILVIGLITAIGEELTFRALIIPPVQASKRMHVYAWMSAIIFSAVHMQFYGFVPRMLLGVVFAYVLIWSGSIWPSVLMHFTNNTVAVLLSYVLYGKGLDPDQIEPLGTGSTLGVGIVSLLLSCVLFYALRRSCTIKSASSRISSVN